MFTKVSASFSAYATRKSALAEVRSPVSDFLRMNSMVTSAIPPLPATADVS